MDGVTHTFARRRALFIATVVAVLGCAFAGAPAAHAALGLSGLQLTAPNSTNAGAHSDIRLKTDISGGAPQGMRIDFPPGMLADLSAATVCTTSQFDANSCPSTSQIGTITASISVLDLISGAANGKIYRLAAGASGEVGRMGIWLHPDKLLGVQAADISVIARATLRDASGGATDQGGLRATILNMPTSAKVTSVDFLSLGSFIYSVGSTVNFDITGIDMTLKGTVNGQPFMNNPGTCSAQTVGFALLNTIGNVVTSLTATGGGNVFTASNCDALTYAPTTAISSVSPNMDTGTGMTVDVNVNNPMPSSGNIKALSKKAVITLPTGVEFNPPGAAALTTCTNAQFAATSSAAETCPSSSIIGSAAITSPLLTTLGNNGTASGNVYFGDTTGSSSEFLRIFVSVSLAGVRIKLIGDVDVDDATGRITATFDNIPQTPFSKFSLTFNGGNTAMLRTPRSCSTTAHQLTSAMTAYGDATPATATPSSALSITGDCHSAGRFAPTVSQSATVTSAGQGTKLTMTMTRPQGDARFTNATVSMPAGLVGKLSSVTPCSTANANAGTCPASSQIGTVETQSGDSAASQATLNGQLYLTQAPSGAIAGLSMKVPAVVGPVNLGNVIVPMKIKLRPSDYGLDIVADSIPDRIQGIPLLLRQIKLVIDRTAGNTSNPFMINSSNCTARSLSLQTLSDQSTSATPSTTYQPSGCSTIGFAPTVAVNPSSSLSPAVSGTADAASAMTVGVTVPASQSAIKDLTLTMPAGVELNPFSATTLAYCSAAQFDASSLAPDACPTSSRIATASIATPSVGTLTGYAYFGAPANSSQILRMFLMVQAGAGTDAIRLKLVGDVDLDPATGRITTRFTGLPAIQFTQLTLSFNGGASAVLRTPHACGTHGLSTDLAPHAGMVNKKPSASLTTTGANCDPGRFSPAISTSVSSLAAAGDTNLTTSITRPNGDARLAKVKVVMPPGLLGNLTAATQCPLATAAAGACGAASEVGTVSTQTGDSGSTVNLTGKVYLTEPPPGGVAGLALVEDAVVGPVDLGKAVVQLKIVMRPDDAGLTIEGDVPTHLKGVPLLLRQISMQVNKPGFLTNRSLCDATAITTHLTSDQGTAAAANTPYQATGCASLSFTPTLSLDASPALPDTAAAMSIAVNLPASGQAQVKDVTVKLPEGIEINPGAGDGLTGCNESQFGPGSSLPAACPSNSRIGGATVTSPLIGTLKGDVYFGDPPAGKLMRMFVVAQQSAGDGVRIKLIGDVDVNPANGQITTTFSNLPQTPFTQFRLDLQGGQRAVLSTPRSCGNFSAASALTPYGGGAGAAPSANLAVGAGCHDPSRFRPAVSLATTTTQAAADTGMTAVVARPDGDARLSRVAVALPDGLLGRLAAVPQCSIAAARAAACPPSSRVGAASTVSGSGASTIALPGDIFLTEGFDGGVAGLAVSVRAKAGPIDLGQVVVLMKITVRPNASGLDILSEPIPTRLQGVPLTIQSIALGIDRPGFLLNRSTCGVAGANAAFTSDLGTTAGSSASLATTGCGNVPFAPTMTVDLTGGLKKDAKPGVVARLAVPAGHANVRKVTLTMPEGLGANIAALGAMCARADYDRGACSAGAVVGTAAATSPALPGALTGPVTLIKKDGSALPDLGVRLRGLIGVDLVGSVSLDKDNRLVTSFDGIPDVPLSGFELRLNGGDKGALVYSGEDFCTAPELTTALVAHTGAALNGKTIPPSSGCAGDGRSGTTSKSSKPSATVKITGLKGGRPTIKVTAKGGKTTLKTLKVTLPKGLTIVRKTAAKKTSLAAKNAKNKKIKFSRKTLRKSLKHTSRSVTLKLPKGGAKTVTVTLRKGTVKASTSMRRKTKVKVSVKLTPTEGKARTQRVTVRTTKKKTKKATRKSRKTTSKSRKS